MAKLYLGSVSEKVSPNDVRETLKGFKRQGRESTDNSAGEILDSAYEQTMNRIGAQSTEFKKLAFNVLSWITCAKTRLNTWELRHALATRSRQSRLDPGDFIQLQLILRVRAGLVIVDEESDIVRLAHHTTEVYFDRRKDDLFPQCEAKITKACITYLSFSTFEDGYCQTPTELERRLDSFKFYEYASHNWGHHAREAKPHSTDIRDFLSHEMKVKASSQALMISNKSPGYLGLRYIRTGNMVPTGFTALHLAAYFGLEELVITLLEKSPPNSRDMYGNTPLMYGAAYGRTAVVKLLLSIDQVQPDAENRELSIAAQKRHGGVVDLLLGHPSVDPNLEFGYDNPTPLSFAAENGHAEIVERLLGHPKIDPNLFDKNHSTPLFDSAKNGHTEVVKLLLEHPDINPNLSDENKSTPLSVAAQIGHAEVVKLLLGHPGMDHKTPLWWATASLNLDVVKLLFPSGHIERSLKGEDDSDTCGTPKRVSLRRHILLDLRNVDLQSKNLRGQTPLHWAIEFGEEDVVKSILRTDVDMNRKDFDGRTPLMTAAICGNSAIMECLLAQDSINPNARDNTGMNPLLLGALHGHESIVRPLLAKDSVDVNAAYVQGETPLVVAALNGHESIVRLLLAKDGVDLNTRLATYLTPLVAAASGGHESIVRLLLAKDGVDVNATGMVGRTPLTVAAIDGHEPIVQLLLAREGAVNATHTMSQARSYISDEREPLSMRTLLDINGGVDLRSQSVNVFAPLDRILANHLGISQDPMQED